MVRTQSRLPSLDLDAKRIAANSFVIALHVAAFALLMAPVAMAPPVDREEQITTIVFEDPVKPEPIVVVPFVPASKPKPERSVPQITQQTTTTLTESHAEVIDSTGTELAVVGEASTTVVETGDSGPALAQLALLSGPAPQYPRIAIREGHEGLVLLRVLVDANGMPQAVQIERSSGHRELDLAAMRQVQARWRFQPALVNGQAATAYALVPINFVLPK